MGRSDARAVYPYFCLPLIVQNREVVFIFFLTFFSPYTTTFVSIPFKNPLIVVKITYSSPKINIFSNKIVIFAALICACLNL